ncbi:DUF4817 domain-containing protein [Trichonephila clavipes]|nr:DUF4817 domain-containing protein [Trichonephila clavipes]
MDIVEFYFIIKSHFREINVFQQKYPGETAPNESTITLLVQQFHDTGSVVDRKRSSRASLLKTKVANVQNALQRSQFKRPSVFLNTITSSQSDSSQERGMCKGIEIHAQMFRLGGQSDANPPVLSPQASLVLIYRPNEEMNGLVGFSQTVA